MRGPPECTSPLCTDRGGGPYAYEGTIFNLSMKESYSICLWRNHIQFVYEGTIFNLSMKELYSICLWRNHIQFAYKGTIFNLSMKELYSICLWRNHIQFVYEETIFNLSINYKLWLLSTDYNWLMSIDLTLATCTRSYNSLSIYENPELKRRNHRLR